MQTTEFYRDIAKTCISNMIHQLVSAMQNYNKYVGKDNRSAGLYNNNVQQSLQLLTACGITPNIEQVDTARNGEYYLVYKSLDFSAHSLQLKDLDVTAVIGNCKRPNVHEFTY